MWGRANDFGRRGPGDPPSGAPLRAIDAVRALARRHPSPQDTDHAVRQARLEQIARTVGAQDLWTFAPVEDDLFLRDCVGAVPGSLQIAAVMNALEGVRRGRAEETAGARRMLVFRPRARTGPVLAAAFPFGWKTPDPRGAELLSCLVDALEAAESISGPAVSETGAGDSDASAGPDPEELPVLLRRRLDDLDRDWIRHSLARSGGDRAEAAARLGISEGELVSRMARLGFS